MSEDKFWKMAFEFIERGLTGACNKCPYKEECGKLPAIEDGGIDCATFLMQKFCEYGGVK